MFNETRSVLEPAGAVGLAGAKAFLKYHNLQGKRAVVVTSGANMNFDRLRMVSGAAGASRRRHCAWCPGGKAQELPCCLEQLESACLLHLRFRFPITVLS